MDQARVDDILVLNTTNKVLIDSVIFFSVCKQPSVSTVQDLVEMLKKNMRLGQQFIGLEPDKCHNKMSHLLVNVSYLITR